jgi:hypothetical protein
MGLQTRFHHAMGKTSRPWLVDQPQMMTALFL